MPSPSVVANPMKDPDIDVRFGRGQGTSSFDGPARGGDVEPSGEGTEQLMAKLIAQQNRLQAYIFTLTGDRDAARDILQATNLVIWRKAREFTPGSNFIAWSFQIARYQVLAHRQKEARERLVFSDDFVADLAISMEGGGAEDLFEAKRAALAGCLEDVAERHRRVLWLFYRDGLRTREIGEHIGKTKSAVEQTLSRVRLSLMRCITRRLSEEGLS